MSKLIGVEEVVGLTSIPESTIRRMVTKARIPCVRLGKHVRFDPEDIAAWIDGNKVPAEVKGRWNATKAQAAALEEVRRAVKFLERRKEDAELQANKEWIEEFKNAIAVIKGLAAYD